MRHAGESSQGKSAYRALLSGRSHPTWRPVLLLYSVDLTGEARRHTETQHSRAASDHGMGILRGCATAKEEDHVLSPKRGDNNSHKTKRHFTVSLAVPSPCLR